MNTSDWLEVLKTGGAGLVIAAFLGLIIWKVLIPMVNKQQEDTKTILLSALEDARKERDLMRQLREKEVDKFLDSMKHRDEKFNSIVEAIRDSREPRGRQR